MQAIATRREETMELPRFVVQKHWARTLHYDFRLEIGGRLVSWAVPKGPSRDPKSRRLSVRMPDHPLDYALFEGTIPAGEYGAGAVMIWDTGSYEALRPAHISPEHWLDRGYLKFILHGTKLRGLWEMVRYREGPHGKETWLWVKIHDRFIRPGYDPESEPLSAYSGRSGEEIRAVEEVHLLPPHERPLEEWDRPCAEDTFDLHETHRPAKVAALF
jgi:bifunctional non-homologous end joining protein LigD